MRRSFTLWDGSVDPGALPPPPPTMPDVVNEGSDSATINVPNPGGSAVTMHVYVDGVKVTSGLGVAFGNYTVTGLTASTSYSIAVTAVNASGAESAASPVRLVTTASLSTGVQHGDTFVLAGAGFGNIPAAVQPHYDTVDNQPSYAGLIVEGAMIPRGPSHPYAAATNSMQFTLANQRHPRSTAAYKWTGNGFVEQPNALGGNNPPSTQRRLYASWWQRASGDPGGSNHSSKFCRIWDDPSGADTRVSWTQMHLTYENNAGQSGTAWNQWGGVVGAWNRMEILIDADAGVIRTWVNGVVRQNVTDFIKNSAEARGLWFAQFGYNTGGGAPPSLDWLMDEVVGSTTPARVELTNNAVYSASTHRELQRCLGWVDSGVTIQVNRGSLPAGTNHLHWVREDLNTVYYGPVELAQ
jgi:hypothetical protein